METYNEKYKAKAIEAAQRARQMESEVAKMGRRAHIDEQVA
jgi:hypothetical protein